MPRKSKKELNVEPVVDAKKLKNKRNNETDKEVCKTPPLKHVKQKATKNETESVSQIGRKRRSVSKNMDDKSFRMKNKVKSNEECCDSNAYEKEGLDGKRMKLEKKDNKKATKNKNVKMVSKIEMDSEEGSDYSRNSRRSRSRRKHKENSFKIVKDASPEARNDRDDEFEAVENNDSCERKREEAVAKKEVKTEVEIMSSSDDSDLEEVAPQTTASQNSASESNKKQVSLNNDGRSASRRKSSCQSKHSTTVDEVGASRKRQNSKTIKSAKTKKTKTEEMASSSVVTDPKLEIIESEVGKMSDSEDSDFEVVTSQTSVPENPTPKQPKKKQTSTNAKGRTANKSKTKSDSRPKKGEIARGRKKLHSNLNIEDVTVEKVKKDLMEEMPSTSKMDGIDEDDVTAVLLRMEGASCSQPSTSEGQGHRISDMKGSSLSDDSDEDDSEDWEEVEDHRGSPLKSRIPTEPVEITLDAPDFMKKKRKKKKFDWMGYIQRTMRRFQKDVQINMHKVHLLCLLSHGFQQNAICNEDLLKAQAISIIPVKWTDLGSKVTRENMKQLLKWFHEEFHLKTKSQYFTDSDQQSGLVKQGLLEGVIASRQIPDGRILAIIFIIILRTLGLDVRLVMSCHPMGIKLSEKQKYKVKRNLEDMPSPEDQNQTETTKGKCDKGSKKDNRTKKHVKSATVGKKKLVKSRDITCSDDDSDDSSESKSRGKSKKGKSKVSGSKEADDGETKQKIRTGKGKQLLKKSRPSSDSDSEDEVKPKRTLRTKDRKKVGVKNEDDVSESGFDEFVPSGSDSDFSDGDSGVKKRKSRKKSGDQQRSASKRGKNADKKQKPAGRKTKAKENKKENVIELSSGSEFTEDEISYRSPLQEKLKMKNRKVLSSDSDNSSSSGESVCDIWTEVFLSGEKKWICVDCIHSIIDKPYEVESFITHPVHYVLAYSAGGYVSDVTARYASQWMSQTRKLRVDPEWWSETLEPYRSQQPEHGEKDEESIKDQLMKRPLPTSIGEFKNHPLYALPRHLLKFEAIYPESAIPFGYLRGEPIYARECVYTLHSRENWLKEGRAVRLQEEAYKMVKSRKRWRQTKPDPNVLDLELFGHWQTEKYIPPPAVDGKITRNAYGNIELFQPWMLPGGTVHLQGFPALNRVAKKLGLDCVPAMVGWDTHSGFSHPLIDGWVVCEEHKDILIAAWDEDQEIQKQREIEKREKRVLGNWKLLTRSLLIRERLKNKFDIKDPEPEDEPEVKDGKKATDTEQAWPQNRKTEKQKKLPKHIETM